jgi:hypothetical protein
MDLSKVIKELRSQKEKIERAIASLEEIQGAHVERHQQAAPVKDRRGRKSMGAEERKQVAARMKRYWANRRSKD